MERKFSSIFSLTFSMRAHSPCRVLALLLLLLLWLSLFFFSGVACSRPSSSLSLFRLNQHHKAEKRFAILIIVFSSTSFLFNREGSRESEEERACDNTYSISIWKRQQADSSNSEEEKKKTTAMRTKEKLYYPIERTRAWSGWLNTYRRFMYIDRAVATRRANSSVCIRRERSARKHRSRPWNYLQLFRDRRGR